jgi:FKBP-type peptidyl-prolyl cis-trans isomerase
MCRRARLLPASPRAGRPARPARLAALVALAALAGCQRTREAPARDAGTGEAEAPADAGAPSEPARRTLQIEPPRPITPLPAEAVRAPSGLVFLPLAAGRGPSPGGNDGVRIRFSAWREDGTTFATTEPSGEPQTRWLHGAAPGFREALRRMKVGGRAMFWLPPEIGYPDAPRGTPQTLAYEVELLGVVPAPPTPPDVGKPPRDARHADDGVRWKRIRRAPPAAPRPRPWDAVELTYTGWDAGGRIFDTRETEGQPFRMPLEALPAPFSAVVPELAAGERARIWLPAELLAGRPRTPPGLLTFELEVTAVVPLEPPPPVPPDVAAPPPDAARTPRGVFYQVLRAGGGTRTPTADDEVTVHYTGWTTDGARFESTIPEGTPRTFRVLGAIAGWTDALLQMPVGDTWRLWIPAELAYQGAPRRPQGMLVFDVELLAAEPAPVPPTSPARPPREAADR